MRTQGPRTLEDAYAEAEKEIDRLRAALKIALVWMPTHDPHQADDLRKARRFVEDALEQNVPDSK